MGSERDAISLDDDNSDFSGFSESEIPRQTDPIVKSVVRKAAPKEKVLKKKSDSSKNVSKNGGVGKKNSSSHSTKKSTSSKQDSAAKSSTSQSSSKDKQSPHTSAHNTKDSANFDLSSMSSADIDNLKQLLGLSGQLADQNRVSRPSHEQPPSSVEDDDDDEGFRPDFNNLSRMNITFDPRDLSDSECVDENVDPSHNRMKLNMNDALYDDQGDCEWDLPRLRVPVKGKPTSNSLAKMINIACTSQCESDTLLSKYNIPENCEMISAPLVNTEIWQAIDKRAQVQDRTFAQIQNFVAGSMTAIVRLAEVLKPQISSNAECKVLLGDALTLLGQTQFNLSVRRRYAIKPNLKRKFFPLCKISQPITTKLFGNDISKEIKACDSVTPLGKFDSFYSKARGTGKFQRRGGNSYNQYKGYQQYSGHGDQRFQPYPQRGTYRGAFRQNRQFKKSGVCSTAASQPPNDK